MYECQNVKEIWNVSNKILKFDVSWKHIVVGFYHEMNEKKNTIIFTNLISFLALRIYKYKMWCRIDEKNESSEEILCNVKYFLNTFYSALQRSKYKLWKIECIQEYCRQIINTCIVHVLFLHYFFIPYLCYNGDIIPVFMLST